MTHGPTIASPFDYKAKMKMPIMNFSKFYDLSCGHPQLWKSNNFIFPYYIINAFCLAYYLYFLTVIRTTKIVSNNI